MTLPMIVGILALISNSIVDTYFVSTLGTDALSALSFTFPVIMVVASLSIGLGAGASSVVSRTIGRGDREAVKRRSTDALILSVLAVTLLVIVGRLTIRPLFSLLGAEGAVLDLIVEYMTIWYYGMPMLVLPMVGGSLMRAAGDARIPGMLMVAGAIINIVLDPILIFGLLGAPRLEVAGAALATVIANGVGAVAALAVLHFRERMLTLHLASWQDMMQSFSKVLHVGLPAAAANMINPLGIGLLTAMLAAFGKESVAGFGVATRIEALANVGLLALSASIGPVIGQNWGARKVDRVYRTLKRAYQFCLVYGLVLAALVALSATLLTGIFTDSETVARVARQYLWIVPVTAFGFGINIAGAAALNAAARPMISTGLTVARMFIVAIPVAYVMSRSFGQVGIFIGVAAANLCAAGLTIWATYRTVRINLGDERSLREQGNDR
ncbi:MAG: MATE family efflux transporter [Xanthomonadales bacterium]|nr:MATE family efflux transporter [Xanthomonadales bacterium]